MLRVYIATAMTGEPQDELVREALRIKKLFKSVEIEVFSPVLEENIELVPSLLENNQFILPSKWSLDKKGMQSCFVFVDTTADKKSEGVSHELGYMRYFLWRPVIRISPRHSNYFSIASIEDDVIVGSVEDALKLIQERWGTWWKRRKWQWGIYTQCLLRTVWKHFRGWFL